MEKLKKYAKHPIFWIDITLLIVTICLGVFVIIEARKPMLIDDYTIHNATKLEEESSANYFEDETKNKTLKEWQEINPEVVYLLKINNKEFPVLHGSTEEYYLDHDVFKKYDIFGSVFLEPSTVETTTKNKIIYGHSTYNKDLMFTFISNYRDNNYYKEHKTFELEDSTGTHTYIVLALMEISDSQKPENMKWFVPNMNEVNASEFVQDFVSGSSSVTLYSSVVSPNKPFVELVTCKMGTTVEDSNGRYVLLAQQVD